MTTYPEYIAQCQRLQRQYITAQQDAIERAATLHRQYTAAMAQIGLQPLDRREIDDRRAELVRMLAEVEENFGDSAVMRRAYEMQFGREAV